MCSKSKTALSSRRWHETILKTAPELIRKPLTSEMYFEENWHWEIFRCATKGTLYIELTVWNLSPLFLNLMTQSRGISNIWTKTENLLILLQVSHPKGTQKWTLTKAPRTKDLTPFAEMTAWIRTQIQTLDSSLVLWPNFSFNIENAKFWPILTNLSYFVPFLCTFWCTFYELN